MVEFSIIAFLLLVLVFGMVDYGRYFLIRANITNAVRDGARYGAVLSEAAGDTVLMRQHTRALISWGPASWKDSGLVAVTFVGATPNRRVHIELTNYPFKPVTFLVIKQAKVMKAVAEFRREVQP